MPVNTLWYSVLFSGRGASLFSSLLQFTVPSFHVKLIKLYIMWLLQGVKFIYIFLGLLYYPIRIFTSSVVPCQISLFQNLRPIMHFTSLKILACCPWSSFNLVRRCHQLLFGFQAKVSLHLVSCQSADNGDSEMVSGVVHKSGIYFTMEENDS